MYQMTVFRRSLPDAGSDDGGGDARCPGHSLGLDRSDHGDDQDHDHDHGDDQDRDGGARTSSQVVEEVRGLAKDVQQMTSQIADGSDVPDLVVLHCWTSARK